VARLADGRAVFVPGTCPGDDVTIDVTEDHGRWARGSVVTLHDPSPDRVTPQCPYFGECGGCQWQHIGYERQLDAKCTTLRENLTRIGHIPEPDIAPPVPAPDAYGYRNKIELSAAAGPQGPVLGFVRAGGTDVLPIDACSLLPRSARRLPKALGGAVRFLSSRGAADIRRVAVRVSTSGEVSVDLWTGAGPFPRAAVGRVIAEATGARTVTRVIIRGSTDRRDVSNVEVLAGPGAWSETLDGDRYLVSAPSFFQGSTRGAALLRERALDLLAADGTMRVADLYAGAGTFTLPIARAAGEIVAVEGSRYALADLRRNLERAGLDADVVPGDAAHALSDLGHLDAALVDPPRSGLSESAMRALVEARIGRIVYVSCDPATLARDVERLTSAGYIARRFVPVDLFPQTYHLETVALLELG
jgi:23S rRNA (uracil1939-C5)-methyltransferase